jgi:hypothetical protein
MPLLKVNQIASYSGNTLTVGTTGDTVTLATGASVSGFGFDGVVWTSNIVTSALTVSANVGYFVNTSAAAITVTLPASASNGDQLVFVDYNRKFGTNALTLNQNSLKFQGFTSPNPVYNTAGQTVQLVYADSTQGWIPISDDDVTNETPQSYSADFLVIAGGAGGGRESYSTGCGGGGGAGGYRSSNATYGSSGGGASAESSLTFVPGTVYTITVGAGGAVYGSGTAGARGGAGGNSSISGTGITTITSTGGGGGGGGPGPSGVTGGNGGSGGGSGGIGAGTGTSGQGTNGGGITPSSNSSGGGGGGSSSAGVNGNTASNGAGGAGGAGTASTIIGSSVIRAGGGGGCGGTNYGPGGAGGTGGGGTGGQYFTDNGTSGTVNTGGGGGGVGNNAPSANGTTGGSGVVILRMPTISYSGTTTGSPTVSTSGSDTILTYTGSGTYTG